MGSGGSKCDNCITKDEFEQFKKTALVMSTPTTSKATVSNTIETESIKISNEFEIKKVGNNICIYSLENNSSICIDKKSNIVYPERFGYPERVNF